MSEWGISPGQVCCAGRDVGCVGVGVELAGAAIAVVLAEAAIATGVGVASASLEVWPSPWNPWSHHG